MWQSETHKCEVIRTLLGSVNREAFWTPTGPTKEARHLLRLGGGYLSSGERMRSTRHARRGAAARGVRP